MDTKLEDLKLRPALVRELSAHGYDTVGDMAHVPDQQLLRIPGMGSADWRRVAKALDRDPWGCLSSKNASLQSTGAKQ